MASVDNMEHKYARASLRITEAMGRVASSGELAGSGMAKVLSIGSDMAFMFGTTGPIVGAIGVATLAIVKMFDRAKEEAIAARKQLQDEFRQIAKLGTAGVSDRLNDEVPQLAEARARLAEAVGTRDALKHRDAQGVPIDPYGMDPYAQVKAVNAAQEALVRQLGIVNSLWAQLRKRVDIDTSAAGFSAEGREISAAEKIRAEAEEAAVAVGRALYTQVQANKKAMQDRFEVLVEAKEREKEVINRFESEKFKAEQAANKKSLEAFEAYNEETKKLIEKQFNERFDRIAQQVREISGSIASAIGGALQAGFKAAFTGGGVVGAIKALGAAILAAFGDILVRIGTTALAAAPFIEAISKALVTLSGSALAFAGLGLIAAGALVGGLAGAIGGAGFSGGGAAGGGSSGGSGYGAAVGSAETTRVLWGADSTSVAAGMTPRSATQIVIVGVDDPKAQRALQEMLRKADRRG